MAIVIGKKQAASLLRDAGKNFINEFCAINDNAIQLRSKEPGVCWKAAGQVAFAAINEFSGPHTTEEDAPLLFRLRTNLYPPPAVYFHLKSPAVRNKLGVSSTPIMATEPALELTALPEEIGKFGAWLIDWLDDVFYQRSMCPTPPIELISWGANDDLSTRSDVLTELTTWRHHLYLWTPKAIAVFEPWLKQ